MKNFLKYHKNKYIQYKSIFYKIHYIYIFRFCISLTPIKHSSRQKWRSIIPYYLKRNYDQITLCGFQKNLSFVNHKAVKRKRVCNFEKLSNLSTLRILRKRQMPERKHGRRCWEKWAFGPAIYLSNNPTKNWVCCKRSAEAEKSFDSIYSLTGNPLLRWNDGTSNFMTSWTRSFTNFIISTTKTLWEEGRDALHIPRNYDSWISIDTTEHADCHKGLIS